MSGYREHLAQTVRAALLQVLAETPAEAASDLVLHGVLADGPYRAALADVVAALRWLAERKAVVLEEVGETLFAVITERGADIVAGRDGEQGIRRLRPR